MGGSSWTMNGGGNWQQAGNGIAAVGTFGGQMWDALSPPNAEGVDKNVRGKTALKGAASGAAIGTQILPGWGTAIGAVVGGIGGWIGGNKAKKRQEAAMRAKQRKRMQAAILQGNQNLIGYDFEGDNYETDLYQMGGQLKPLNSDTVEVQGPSHAQGGVKLGGDAEVEGGETISGDFVFSDYLGYADKHKELAKQIGKIERKPLNRERRVTLEILRKKESALKQDQETLKSELGLPTGSIMQMGGQVERDFSKQPFTLDEWRYKGKALNRNWEKYPLTPQEVRGWTTELNERRMETARQTPISPTVRKLISDHRSKKNNLLSGFALTEPEDSAYPTTNLYDKYRL